MKSLKVLSIDWDYFIKVSMDVRMNCFPDGGTGNINPNVQSIIWASLYKHKELSKVKIDIAELINLKVLLNHSVDYYDTKVIVAESHEHIYKAVHRMIRNNQSIELYNIDFHHDTYGTDGTDVDCGNWQRILIDEDISDSQYTWIKRPESDDTLYTLDTCKITDINSDVPFDLVFLCRSNMWSPPHLDIPFIALTRYIRSLTSKGKLDIIENVEFSRYTSELKELIKFFNNIDQKGANFETKN